jgi:hypothetical protein
MDRQVFGECQTLRTVIFASGSVLTSIGSEFVGYGGAFESVTFPESLRTIGVNAFTNQYTVKTLRMHRDLWDQVTPTLSGTPTVSFYSDPVYYTWNGGELIPVAPPPWIYDVGNPSTASGPDNGTMTIIGTGQLTQSQANAAIDNYNASGKTVALHSIEVAGDFTSLGVGVFQSTDLTSVIFPHDSLVTSIGSNMVYTCSLLTNLVLPPKITTLPDSTCTKCVSLKEVLIPTSVTSFGSSVFESCSQLQTIVIPSAVRTIGTHAFISCVELHTVVFAPDSMLISVGTAMFYNCRALTTVDFPASLRSIGKYALTGATSIQSLKMHRDIWTIISDTLPSNSNGLDHVITFYNDPVSYLWKDGNLTTLLAIVGEGKLSRSFIDAYVANNGSGLGLIIDVDKAITSLDEGIFSGLTGLTVVRFPVDSVVQTIGARTFQGCSALQSIVFPVGVTTFGAQAFQGCSSLQSIVVPSTVTTIEGEAFHGTTSLVTVTFPGPVTTMGDSVFKGCTLLKEVIFPDGLTTLGARTFEGCVSLENIVFPKSLVTITGTETLVGATAVRSLKMREENWETSIGPSLVQNPNFAQLVQFYGDAVILQLLETQVDFWSQNGGGSDMEGYKKVVEYYNLDRNNFTVDWSSGGGGALVKTGTLGLVFDADTGSLTTTGIGTYDGVLTISGSNGGELTQTLVDTAISAHSVAQNGLMPLSTLTVGANFTSLATSLSLHGTGISILRFPAESPITSTGVFRLSIDSTLANSVVLPKWVVQPGPWSL